MPNIDEHGNKIATKVEKKSVISANIRQKRKSLSGNMRNRKHCPECGFRIRGKGHTNGDHHNEKAGK